MKKSKTNFFEKHVDKLVLVIFALLSLWLLWQFVLSGPYHQEFSGRRLSPGEIDLEIARVAEQLNRKLDEAPSETLAYSVHKPEYDRLIANAIQGVDYFTIPLPGLGERAGEERRQYELPPIPALENVAVGAIRTVVHKPATGSPAAVDAEMSYGGLQTATELGDIDLVTVSAGFNTAELYRNFESSFTHRRLKPEWIDPRYAKPVFAKVQLQRRRLLQDGSWSDWTIVPEGQAHPADPLLPVPESATDSTYSVDILMNQFDKFEVVSRILQPDPYSFASPRETWLPPELHARYAALARQVELKERQEELERLRELREAENDRGRTGSSARSGRTGTTGRNTRTSRDNRSTSRDSARGSRRGRGGEGGMYGEYGLGESMTPVRPEKKAPTPQDVVDEFKDLRLDERTPLEELETLTLWAFDDTAKEPGTYQYRIRLGVFNPVAGYDWYGEDHSDVKDQMIFWTAFSEPAGTVTIDPMVHFFPRSAKAQDGEKVVAMEVARYHLGRWRSHEFQVRSGEGIGRKIEVEPERPTADPRLAAAGGRGGRYERESYDDYGYGGGMAPGQPTGPEEIDFSTGRVMVDVVDRKTWTGPGNLRESQYADVLYTLDGVEIAHLPADQKLWPDRLSKYYSEVKDNESLGPIVYLSPGQSGGTLRGGRGTSRYDVPGGRTRGDQYDYEYMR